MQQNMTVHCPPSARAFLDGAGADLLADEIRHSLAYGIAERVTVDAHAFGPDDPWFLILENSGRTCATAIRTPPHRPILAHLRGDTSAVCSTLVHSIHEMDKWIPGVVGEKELADRFTRGWCTAYGSRVKAVMAQRIYRLTEVVEPSFAPGGMRNATMAEAKLVESWAAEFHRETDGDEPSPTHRELYRERIQQGSVYLWENSIPVSMAMSARPTRNGITIGAVYTPPGHRNCGYATSCVACLCKELLRKYRFCVLYTDLSNPVSNFVYKQIGFKEYCDSAQYSYDQNPSGIINMLSGET
jgi:predicted GNAT family acetyltransferase